MEEWLTVLLGDMNFNPDKEVRIAINGYHVDVRKSFQDDSRAPTDGKVASSRQRISAGGCRGPRAPAPSVIPDG